MQKFMGTLRSDRRRYPLVVAAAWPLVLGAVCMLLTATIGCGSAKEKSTQGAATGQVSGTVAIAGRPVPRGTVCFYSLKSNTSEQAPLGKNGQFQLKNALAPGEYRVYLNGVPNAPEKFRSETSTDYSVTVKEGSNQVAVDLK